MMAYLQTERLRGVLGVDRFLDLIDCCPFQATVGRRATGAPKSQACAGLYSAEERRRRDESPWTLVQGILAPLQFLVFLVSLAFVLRFLATGEGFVAASASVLAKTLLLYTIMVTGSIWEKDVFGRWLFAPAFFWEDAVSIVVLTLHTAYLCALFFGLGDARSQMYIALAAYAAYLINAAQFLIKLRMARLQGSSPVLRMNGVAR
jgi:3-vinyl bacteriochlorophyllide hydratase